MIGNVAYFSSVLSACVCRLKMYNRWQHLQNLKNIFLKSVESVRPHNLLSALNNYNLEPRSEGNRVFIQLQAKRVDITNKRCHAVGFGKAVLGMAVELEKALGDALKQGILSIPKVSYRFSVIVLFFKGKSGCGIG